MDTAAQWLMDTVEASGAEAVRILFVDYNGIARARALPVDALRATLARGVNFSSPTLDFTVRDTFPSDAAFTPSSPDVWARPDPSTYIPAPAVQRTGQLLADLVDARGSAWPGCPRTALRRMEERGLRAGLAFNVGLEPEGYLFRGGDGVSFTGRTQFATADGLNLDPAFLNDLLSYLAAANIAVQQWSEEYGPGQIEINVRHAHPVQAADALVTFKGAFRAIAAEHGYLGTFMPKPFEDCAGSGLHVHLSASSPQDEAVNLFDDPEDIELALSPTGRHALAGLLAHGAALTALGATTVNSYKRFLPGSWAPTHIMYAYASRAAFVRIPERETPRRLELRAGDPAGNPYIFLTGVLAAALDGIERSLPPGPQTPGDVFGPADGIQPLPRTLGEGLDALERDDVMREALGDIIVNELIKIKRSEWESFCRHVGEWDRAWYLNRF